MSVMPIHQVPSLCQRVSDEERHARVRERLAAVIRAANISLD